jgi:hypothetical protein
LLEANLVSQRGKKTKRIEIFKIDESHPRRIHIAKRGAGIAPEVAERGVERREKPLVSRREDDQTPSRREPLDSAGNLAPVILNVFQNININDTLETILGRVERFDSPYDDANR